MKKIRVDLLLVEKELSLSIEKAKKEIISGWVKVNGETVRDPSKKISSESDISVERPGGNFVSRGGEKLNRALKVFNIDLTGFVTLDLGASTGGFTDCMLKKGAVKVYAVDVGFNQLDYSLRIDDRVVVMEKTHAKNLTKDMFSEKIDFFSADLSFISILKILPVIYGLFESVEAVVLIKPQFEAKAHEHDKGVVRDIEVHESIVSRVVESIKDLGYNLLGLTYSPLKGPAGNIEFLAHISKDDSSADGKSVDVSGTVKEAHENL